MSEQFVFGLPATHFLAEIGECLCSLQFGVELLELTVLANSVWQINLWALITM